MVDIAARFLGPAIQVVQWVAAPILRQFNYLCCFSSNITSLKNEAQKLQVTEGYLQGKVDRARDDVRVISGEVETWLKNSKDIKDETEGIFDEVPNVESGCLKLRARFSLSKRAKKTTDRLKELRDQCTFDADAISQPRPPAATEAIPLENTYEFESRKQIEEDIMATLVGGDVNLVGICGMGGLGKTTMAKRIMNKGLKEHIFDEVVMAVVSQQVDKLKLQVEISGSLGLRLEGETSQARVQKLHARLSGTKRILLVLDDVWERFVLEDLGIPCNHKGCAILLTSRNRDVLSAMNVRTVFGMEVLSEEDAWFLFRERTGPYVDNTRLNSIAKEVVNECRGLPIALTTVGVVLRDESNISIWKDALRQLRQCDPDIPEFIANVYNPLKLSYDVLGFIHKSVFLLCCLYPEDAEIPLERLTYFSMGLGIFEGGIRNVEEARNRMHALTKMLKSRSLLLDSNIGDDHVRMHDVVRDVCIFIAKQEGYIGGNDCTWFSSSQRSELSIGLGFPNLRLSLWIHNSVNEEFELNSHFREGIRDLYVLCIEKFSLTSLPRTTESLRKLNTLVLVSCDNLATLSSVGELVNLEIFICRGCGSIKELPPEMTRLNRLKLLDLTRCRNLQRIGRGIISSLVGLEELKMLESFKKWEAEDREEKENVGLRELEALTNLRCLEIEIDDPALAAENMHISSKMDRFHISISVRTIPSSMFDSYRSNRKMRLCWEGENCLGDWIEMQFLKDIECLCLNGNGAKNVDLTKIQNIRLLELERCNTIEKIVTTSIDVISPIEFLRLYDLPKLEKIWDGPVPLNSFQNAKELRFYDLPKLKQLWKSSSLHQSNLGKDCLPQLQVLIIQRCEMMEQVFLCNGEDENGDNITRMFPKLKEVVLKDLPNLTSFCQGIEGIEFPQMWNLDIRKCRKMKSIVSNGVGSNENNMGGSNDADIHKPQEVSFRCLKQLITDWNPFCGHKIPISFFNNLEELKVHGYEGSISFITPSIARNLVNLTKLAIKNCDEMVQVIIDEEKGMSSDQRTLLFPKLHTLELYNLRNLVRFCEWKCEEQLVSLSDVEISRCPSMKQFWKSSSPCQNHQTKDCLPQLEVLKIWGCRMIEQVFLYKREDENENNSSQSPNSRHITKGFPKLNEIDLHNLPNLTSFYEGIEGIKFPQLLVMRIKDCGKMKRMVSKVIGSNKNDSGCSSNADVHHIFCQPQEVSFGCLKQLISDWNPFCSLKIHVSLFERLEKITISGYQGSMSFIMSSVADNLVNLKFLRISFCYEMVQVIKNDEDNNMLGGQGTLLFPKLHTLQLLNLPKLVSFCEWECDVELLSLTKLEIVKCSSMKNFTVGSLAAPNLESFDTDLNNHLRVPFKNLKESTIRGNGNPLKCYKFDGSFFNGLEMLQISEYHGTRSLFSSSITENLVNLSKLTIYNCREMVKMIENEEDEKGVSGGGRTPFFPKLQMLLLYKLSKLVSICEWKFDVELPSLREVHITMCPNIKNFTLGHLSTPNLKTVQVSNQNFGAVKDLNVVLQQEHFA